MKDAPRPYVIVRTDLISPAFYFNGRAARDTSRVLPDFVTAPSRASTYRRPEEADTVRAEWGMQGYTDVLEMGLA